MTSEKTEPVIETILTPEAFLEAIGASESSLPNRNIFLLSGPLGPDNLNPLIQRMWALHFDETCNEPIQLIINSPGGLADIGWAFIDTMEAIRLPIRTIGLGMIGSLATMIFVAGDERVISHNTLTMIHHFSTGLEGNYKDLVAARKMEDLMYQNCVGLFKRHSKYKTEKAVSKHILLDQDHWLSPEEMLKHGLCDTIIYPRPRKRKKK